MGPGPGARGVVWAAGQVQTAEEGEGEGDSSLSSHRSFLPTVFSAPSLWAPESEASRAVTSLSLYTNSCVFLLLFTAKGVGPSSLPAPCGLRSRFKLLCG